jgi:signal peptidase I
MSTHKIVHSAREILLTIGALLGAGCLLATAAGYAFGITPLVFRSGSMSPEIHTGDLAVARTVDAASLKVGDIVSVVNADGNRVTHRVRNIAAQGDARQLTLQGDANKAPDAEVYTVTRAERVLFDIPRAGYLVDAAAGPVGLFVLGAFVTGMLVLAFRRRPTNGPKVPSPPKRGGARKARRTLRSRLAVRSAALLVVAATVMVASPASAAFWTDPAPVTGSTLTAYTLPAPVVSCGNRGTGTVTLNWTAVTGATGYVLHYGTGGATSQTVSSSTLSKTFNAPPATSGTFTVQAQRNYGSVTWTSVASNSKNYSVASGVMATCS